MKRVIASTQSLVDLLEDDLNNSFEDNIVMRYASHILDPDIAASPEMCRKMYRDLMKARRAYINAMADVIKNDVISEVM